MRTSLVRVAGGSRPEGASLLLTVIVVAAIVAVVAALNGIALRGAPEDK